jgi:phosphohistidine phosphatase
VGPDRREAPSAVQHRLLLVRHSKSQWPGGVPDHDRPLARRGLKEAPAAGRWLAAAGLVPDESLVSDAVRSLQTYELMSAVWPEEVPPTLTESAYRATAGELLATIAATAPQTHTLLVLGHNPAMEELAALLEDGSGAEEDSDRMAAKFPTGAIAVLHVLVPSWAELSPATCRLAAFAIPR